MIDVLSKEERRKGKLLAKAIQVLSSYGTLRWCSGGICACMGCANHTMTKEEFDEVCGYPEIAKALSFQMEREKEKIAYTVQKLNNLKG